jgi:hypothetical protein
MEKNEHNQSWILMIWNLYLNKRESNLLLFVYVIKNIYFLLSIFFIFFFNIFFNIFLRVLS